MDFSSRKKVNKSIHYTWVEYPVLDLQNGIKVIYIYFLSENPSEKLTPRDFMLKNPDTDLAEEPGLHQDRCVNNFVCILIFGFSMRIFFNVQLFDISVEVCK